jgi:AcrR family transcriptional regulator
MSKKNLILHHATALFARKGFKETAMAEVSLLSGVASATIFYHFASKEELLLAILKRVKEEILQKFEHYKRNHEFENGYHAVKGAITYYLGLAAEMEDEFLLLHRHFLYQLAEVNPICRNHLEEIYNCLVDIIERGIVKGLDDGSIGRIEAHKTALILFSTVDGMVRFNTYGLYDAGTLYQQLVECCDRILAPQ